MVLRLKYLCWINCIVVLGILLYLFKVGFSITKCSNRVDSQESQLADFQTKTTDKVSPTKESHQHPLVSLKETLKLIVGEFRTSVAKFESAKRTGSSEKFVQPASCKAGSPFLLIEVHSNPKSFVARQAIRLSWGSPNNNINKISSTYSHQRTWKTVFLLGKSTNQTLNALIQQESRTYKDVVVGDFLDTYRHLTLKTLLTLEWPAKYCSSAEYVLKTDQDCYINVFSLMKWLYHYHDSNLPHNPPPLYMGRIHWKNTPSRGNTSKFYVTMQEFSGQVYPPYAAGGGYVFTASLIPKLLEASKSTAVFPMEDAYFGSLMKRVRVKPTNQKMFMPYEFCKCIYWKNGEKRCRFWHNDSVCNIAVVMVIHDIRPIEQIRMHVNVLTVRYQSSICKHERSRQSWKTNCKFVN